MTTTTEIKTKFDHSTLCNKARCTQYLREFGVAKDWARVSLGDMRRLLATYDNDKLFRAARVIVEREGDVYDRSVFECDDDDEAPEIKVEPKRHQADHRGAEVAIPSETVTVENPSIAEVAALLARLINKQSVNVEQVNGFTYSVVTERTEVKFYFGK